MKTRLVERPIHERGAQRRTARQVTLPDPAAQTDAASMARALADPVRAPSQTILALQRTHGNDFVQRLIAHSRPVTQAASAAGGAVDDALQMQIDRAQGTGVPLDPRAGSELGETLGADFGGVRVHADAQADRISRSLNAKAFTVGRDVFFAKGAYQPGSGEGKRLLAHELTHVVQQGGATAHGAAAPRNKPALGKLRIGPAHDRFEQEAARAAKSPAVPNDRPVASRAPGPSIQRWVKVPLSQQTPTNWAGLGADLRVSNDGNMAVKDSPVFAGGKEFYATPGVITDAQTRLATVESPYTVAPGENTITGKISGTGGLFKKAQSITLTEVIPSDTRRGGPAASGQTLATIEACSAHGLDFMGVGTDAAQQRQSNREARIAAAGQDVVNTGSSLVKGRSDVDARDFLLIAIARRVQRLDASAPNPTVDQAKAVYQGLSEKDKNRYAREYGINQYAEPEVGEGIEAIRGAGKRGASAFPMHFAPVIARSGGDYVTLENYARNANERGPGDTSAASNQWYFRMYGPGHKSANKDQSYFGEHAAEASLGNRTELMGLRNRNVAKDDDAQ